MAREVDYIEIVAKASGQQELQKVGGIVDELIKRAQNAGVSVDDLADSLKGLGKKVENTQSYDDLILKMKQIAGITAVGMGIKKSINIFTAFDDVARRVQGTTGANAETMELLRYQAKELGRTTSWSASEAAEAQFEFAKAGFTTNEILAATGGILDTATASQMGLAEATEITAGALRMFGLDASKSTQVGDMLTKTASSTTTDVRDLAEALKYSGNGARQFGLDLQQTLGILGKLGDRMLKGSEAGTGLQAVFASLLNSKKASMLVDIGVNLTEDGSYRNILDIIDDIKEKTSNMEEVQRLSLIQEVFGDQGSRVMNNILALEKDEIKNLIKEIENSSGFSQELANTLNAGLGGSFRNLTSATEGLAIAFGEYLEPTAISLINATTQLISAGTGAIEWLNSGSYLADTLTFAISALTGGYMAYKGVLIATTIWEKALAVASGVKTGAIWASNAAIGVANFVTALLTGNMTLATIGTWGLNTALAVLASPVALIVGAVVGLGIGFYTLYQRSERFRNGVNALISPLKELWNWIKKFEAVGAVIDFGKDVYNKAKNFVTAGTQGKTQIETEKEIQDRINQVQNNSNYVNEVSAGTGEGLNTDYLISGSGKSSNGKIKHNGYYLKGTSISTQNYNIDNRKIANNSSNENNLNSYQSHTYSSDTKKVITNFSTQDNSNSYQSTIYNSDNRKINNNSSNEGNKIYTTTNTLMNNKTIEEKILDALLSIKNLLSSKGEKGNNEAPSNSQIIININKGDNINDIVAQVVEDLTIALANI